MCALLRENAPECDGEQRRTLSRRVLLPCPLEPTIERTAQWCLHSPLERLRASCKKSAPAGRGRIPALSTSR